MTTQKPKIYQTPNGEITSTELRELGLIGEPPDFMRPVLFLDNDGVVNIDGIDRKNRVELRHAPIVFDDESEFGQRGINETEVYWDPIIVERLQKMNAVWVTSWKRLAVEKLNPVYGFEFPYIDWLYKGVSDYGQYGKATGIGKIVRATGCDWVVVDDDFAQYTDVLEIECEKNGVVIAPDFELGLTRDEIQILERVMENKSPVVIGNGSQYRRS